MPAHQIHPDQVATYLAGSAVQVVLEHRTNLAAAALIEEVGVDLDRCAADAAWGRGFYCSNHSELQHGRTVVRVAVRLLRPLLLPDTIRGAAIMDELLQQAGTED